MNQTITDLIELQKKDIKIAFLEKFLEQAPGLLTEVADQRQAAEGAIEAKHCQLDQARQNLKRKERELEDGESRIEQLQVKLNQVKTNKEYEAALKEIEDQKARNSAIEDDILGLFDEVEEAEEAKGQLESRWSEQAAGFDRQTHDLEARVRTAGEELEKATEARKQLVETLAPEIVGLYEKVKNATGRSVVKADKEICHGCYRQIPAQMYNMVLKGEEVIKCPNCQRIMVHLEQEIEEGLEEI